MTHKKNNMTLMTDSPEMTTMLGQRLAWALKPGDVIALSGELGSGKTCLTQGIARGLGVPVKYAVTSPTFTLLNEYPGEKMPLFHMDAYRLGGCGDLEDMGYDEYLLAGGVMVIEWAEKISPAIPADALSITMSYVGEQTRSMEISGNPDKICLIRQVLNRGDV